MNFLAIKELSGKEYRINLTRLERYYELPNGGTTAIYFLGEESLYWSELIALPKKEFDKIINQSGLAEQFLTLTRTNGPISVNFEWVTQYYSQGKGTTIYQPSGSF